MSVELRNLELDNPEPGGVDLGVDLGFAEPGNGTSSGESVAAVEAGQPDFHVSPVMAAASAGVLGVAALAFYIYGHLPGS